MSARHASFAIGQLRVTVCVGVPRKSGKLLLAREPWGVGVAWWLATGLLSVWWFIRSTP